MIVDEGRSSLPSRRKESGQWDEERGLERLLELLEDSRESLPARKAEMRRRAKGSLDSETLNRINVLMSKVE